MSEVAPETIIYGLLCEPFEKTLTRPDGMTYVSMQQVTSRMNSVLGVNGWSFSIREHGYSQQADSYWALGRLEATIGGSLVVREQFGSQKLNRFRPKEPTARGDIIDVGNDMKGAGTDAFKKCAASLGVGLYLSGMDA